MDPQSGPTTGKKKQSPAKTKKKNERARLHALSCSNLIDPQACSQVPNHIDLDAFPATEEPVVAAPLTNGSAEALASPSDTPKDHEGSRVVQDHSSRKRFLKGLRSFGNSMSTATLDVIFGNSGPPKAHDVHKALPATAPKKKSRFNLKAITRAVSIFALDIFAGSLSLSRQDQEQSTSHPESALAPKTSASSPDIYGEFEDVMKLSRLEEPLLRISALRLLSRNLHPDGRRITFPVPAAIDELNLRSVGLPIDSQELLALTKRAFLRRGVPFSLNSITEDFAAAHGKITFDHSKPWPSCYSINRF